MSTARLTDLSKPQLIRLVQEKNSVIARQLAVIRKRDRELRALKGDTAMGDKYSSTYRGNRRDS